MLCLLALESTAQKVTNARFVQEGKQVKIYYDLTEEADVSIYLSTDGGKTYETSPLGHLNGHAGKAVQAGTDRCAVWDVLSDREKLQGSDVRFKIVAARRGGNQNFTVGGVTFTMVHVQGGTFTMGCTSEQGSDCYDDEEPAHSVMLSDYYIGETEVTQAMWRAVMGNNPSYWKGDNLPVENVSWEDCQEFVRKLNQMTGKNFRLPTEAEWEFAARGGNKSRGYKYSGSNTLSSVAWYTDNSGGQTHPVRGKQPNELGLYDMSGNVWELCQDWKDSYGSGSQSNPVGPVSGSYRVSRGGSWVSGAWYCRVSRRDYYYPTLRYNFLGLRLALVR